MDENIEWMLNQENAEKKKTGRSYFNTANVHAKRKDHLPYEMLKGKERREYMQGSEVKTYNIAPQPNGVTFNLEGFTKLYQQKKDIISGVATVGKTGVRITAEIGEAFGCQRFDLYSDESRIAFVPCKTGIGESVKSAKGGWRIKGVQIRDAILHKCSLSPGDKCKAEYNKGVILLWKE